MNYFVYVLFLCVTAAAATPKLKPLAGDVEYVTVEAILTGHARDKRSGDEGCDFPHALSFRFELGDDDVVLNLEKNVFMSRRVPIYVTSDGNTRRDESADENEFATYQDVTRGSSMLVSCQEDGNFRLHGSFQHGGASYHMSHSDTPEPSAIHYIQRDAADSTSNLHTGLVTHPDDAEDELPDSRSSSRQKRADIPGGNIVELLFTIDRAFYDFFKEDQVTDEATKLAIEQYAALLANSIDLHFCSLSLVDPSLTIQVYLVGVEIPEVGTDVSWSSNSQRWYNITFIDACVILPNVRSWLSAESNLPQNDHIMALSVIEFAHLDNDTLCTDPRGRAYSGTVCSPTYKCSFSEVDGQRVGLVAARQLAVGLGATYDNSSECPASAKTIMAPTFSITENSTTAEASWKFSECSVAAFESKIDSLGGDNCMQEHNFTGDDYAALQAMSLAGTVYSIDQQCQMFQGWWSSSCNGTLILNEEDCYSGFPCDAGQNTTTICEDTATIYPLAGTPCGAREDNKWCYRGICRVKSEFATTSTTSTPTASTISTTSTMSTTTTSTPTTSLSTTTTPTTSSSTSTPTTSLSTTTTPTTSSSTTSTPTTSSSTTTTPTTSSSTTSAPTTSSSTTTTPTTSSSTTSTPTTSSSTTTTPTTSSTTTPTTTSITTSSTPTTSSTTISTTTANPCDENRKCCKVNSNGKKKCCKGSKCCKSVNAWSCSTPCYSTCCNTVTTWTTTSITTATPCDEKRKCCLFNSNGKKKCCKGSKCCKSANAWSCPTPCYSTCCNTV